LLVVAASAKAKLPQGLADSKVLSKKKRLELRQILEDSCIFGEGWVEPQEIDDLGLSQAMRLAVGRALSNLGASGADEIIMDGTINYCSPNFLNVRCEARADSTFPVVSAASIYAKVTRDQLMYELAKKHPGYGFENHVGYGTAGHLDGLKRLGVCSLHRRSYKPVQAFL
jgi:ribonuclease HII